MANSSTREWVMQSLLQYSSQHYRLEKYWIVYNKCTSWAHKIGYSLSIPPTVITHNETDHVFEFNRLEWTDYVALDHLLFQYYSQTATMTLSTYDGPINYKSILRIQLNVTIAFNLTLTWWPKHRHVTLKVHYLLHVPAVCRTMI